MSTAAHHLIFDDVEAEGCAAGATLAKLAEKVRLIECEERPGFTVFAAYGPDGQKRSSGFSIGPA
jgi:hypothetical protein